VSYDVGGIVYSSSNKNDERDLSGNNGTMGKFSKKSELKKKKKIIIDMKKASRIGGYGIRRKF